MKVRNKKIFWYKVNGLLRYILAHTATEYFPMYVINEYPKSGGSWIGEMLGDALDLPFPRNKFPVMSSSILHGHMMHSWNMNNVVLVWRDGRDVLVSQYFYYLFKNDKDNEALVEHTRKELSFNDYKDVLGNMPQFIEYIYTINRHPRMTWVEFVDKWSARDDFVHVKYEDMLEDPCNEMSRIVFELCNQRISQSVIEETVHKYSFEKVSGRKPGSLELGSFLRKGVAGDWKNYFSAEANRIFNHHAGAALVKLGYVHDDSWV